MTLLETIKIKNNKIFNIHYHNERVNKTRRSLFGADDYIALEEIISIPKGNELLKCRIIYDSEIQKIEFETYKMRSIKSLKIIHSDSIDYQYKYADRSEINKLLELKEECDDILIVKDNRISDTSFTNIAFYDGVNWLTPAAPLVKGTKRAKLIDNGKIIEKDIFLNDLKTFKKAILFNSMIEFDDELIIDIKNIF